MVRLHDTTMKRVIFAGHKVSHDQPNFSPCTVIAPLHIRRTSLLFDFMALMNRWILPCLLLGCSAECDLSGWLNEDKGADKGYHVLCVTETVKIHVTWILVKSTFGSTKSSST